jgi:hypothetical protein
MDTIAQHQYTPEEVESGPQLGKLNSIRNMIALCSGDSRNTPVLDKARRFVLRF